MHAITVAFRVKANCLEDFLREMKLNAKRSLEREPGCRHFDVCVSPEDCRKVFLYELYDDREAFDLHLASEHFQTFDRLTTQWIDSKEVQAYIRC